MALQAHPIEPAQERLIGDGGQQAGGHQSVPMVEGPGTYPLRGPADVAIAKQGGQVIGDRACYRILKIDHRQRPVLQQHEIAAVKIPVHQHRRLLQRTVHQFPPQRGAQALFDGVGGIVQQGLYEPRRETPQFLLQQGRVVSRERRRRYIDSRHPLQDIQGAAIVLIDCQTAEGRQQQPVTQVLQQQEPPVEIGGIQRRHPDPRCGQQFTHLYESPVVLGRRRRFGHYVIPPRQGQPEIAPVTGITGHHAQ